MTICTTFKSNIILVSLRSVSNVSHTMTPDASSYILFGYYETTLNGCKMISFATSCIIHITFPFVLSAPAKCESYIIIYSNHN